MKKGALSDVKVLSFAQLAQGPAAVQYLADMGADVIKVERPQSGAWERSWSGVDLYINGESVFFLALNRNQKSITVDLKEEEGKEIIYKLVPEVDVVLENYRPGVMDRLGLGYEKLAELNPGLIYASASGYGAEGPYRDKPGQDLLAQAMSGLGSVTGRKGDFPTLTGASIVDIHSASLTALGIMFALYNREKTGKGQKVEVNLLQAALDLQIESFTYFLNGGGDKMLDRSEAGISAPFYQAPTGVYETRDGYIVISLTPLRQLGEALELEELSNFDQADAFAERDKIKSIVDKVIKMKTTAEWLTILEQKDIWCAPIHNYEDVARDPQIQFNEVIQGLERDDLGKFKVVDCPIHLSETKSQIRQAPPKLGEHTLDILQQIGYDQKKIKRLKQKGIV